METIKIEKKLTAESLKEFCRKIHEAIHSDVDSVELEGEIYPIFMTKSNDCRTLIWRRVRFMEQNKNKPNNFGARARAGEHITWGIRPGTNWIYISDKEVNI